jgi:hypothetical protein
MIVSTYPKSHIVTAADITGSLAVVGDTVILSSVGGGNYAHFVFSGVATAANITFEKTYNGTLWVTTQMHRDSSGSSSTTTGSINYTASTLEYYEGYIEHDVTRVRARLTAITSGSVSVSAGAAYKTNVKYNYNTLLSGSTTAITTAARNATSGNMSILSGYSANPTVVTTGRPVDALADLIGTQIVGVGGLPQLQLHTNTTITVTTETTVIAATTSNRNIIYEVDIANLGANAVRLDLRSATAGAIIKTYNIPAGESLSRSYISGITQAAINTAWTATATGTTPNVVVSLSYFARPY